MSKKIFLAVLFLGFLFVFPQMSGLIKAQALLPMIIDPLKLSNQDSSGVDVWVQNLRTDQLYYAMVDAGSIKIGDKGVVGNSAYPGADGTIYFHLCPTGSTGLGKVTVATDCKGKTFEAGAYAINLFEDNLPSFDKKLVTKRSFEVYTETVGTISFINTGFKTSDEIIIRVDGLRTDGSYKILVDRKDPNKGNSCLDAKNGSFESNIGSYYEGEHVVRIYKNNVQNNPCAAGTLMTWRTFPISNAPLLPDATPIGPGPTIGVGASAPGGNIKDICKEDPAKCTKAGGDPCSDARGPAFKTAVGCIHTNPAEFAKDLLTWVIGIGGGIAFLMMLLGAFQMLTSAGNPETLQAGRDRLTSAVIGLLFIIFAVLLLQIIGADILGLKGFEK